MLKKVDFEVFLLNLALFIVENGTFLMKIIEFSIRVSPLFNSTLHDGSCLALFYIESLQEISMIRLSNPFWVTPRRVWGGKGGPPYLFNMIECYNEIIHYI